MDTFVGVPILALPSGNSRSGERTNLGWQRSFSTSACEIGEHSFPSILPGLFLPEEARTGREEESSRKFRLPEWSLPFCAGLLTFCNTPTDEADQRLRPDEQFRPSILAEEGQY